MSSAGDTPTKNMTAAPQTLQWGGVFHPGAEGVVSHPGRGMTFFQTEEGGLIQRSEGSAFQPVPARGRAAHPSRGGGGNIFQPNQVARFQPARGHVTQPPARISNSQPGPGSRFSRPGRAPLLFPEPDSTKESALKNLAAARELAVQALKAKLRRGQARDAQRATLTPLEYAESLQRGRESDLILLKPLEDKIAELEGQLGLPPSFRLS
jgi:hypothetical protein